MCERRIPVDQFVKLGTNTFARINNGLDGGGTSSTTYRIDADGNLYQARIRTLIPGTRVYGREVGPRTSNLRPNLKIGREAMIQRAHPDVAEKHQIVYDSQIPSRAQPEPTDRTPIDMQTELDLGLS